MKVLENGVPALYYSVVDDNTGNEVTNTEYWAALNLGGQSSGTSLPLFTPVMQDHVLSFEESKGYALQGTYVYKTGVEGERYGYPEFVQKCFDEKTAGEAAELTVGNATITIYKNTNGHIYYDISDKATVDSLFESAGIADMYGVDEENERIFLPRNNWFMQLTTDISKVNEYNEAGLPNITGTFRGEGSNHYSGAIYKAGVIDNESGINWVNTPNSDTLVGLDASRSSSVYGKSNTVQPTSSNKLLYYVVGNTTEITNVSTTVPETEVLSQVNKNTSDILTKTDKAQAANAAAPSITKKIDLTLGASDAIYIAPTDGYFTINKMSTAANQFVMISLANNNWLSNNVFSSANGQNLNTSLYVPKGATVVVSYSAGGVLNNLSFIPAQGEESEVE